MKVLVTGARGFIGRNVCASLENIRDGKDRREALATLLPLEIFEATRSTDERQLEEWCRSCDFVVHLAGVNRPEDDSEFMKVNCGFLEQVIELLQRQGNTCPILLGSSVQASLAGRFSASAYGKSKRAAEEALQEHVRQTGADALVYRFPNVYGKWCRPNYNSVVATFCFNAAHGMPLRVDDPSVELSLLYIDDLVEEVLRALLGQARRDTDGLCEVGPVDTVTVGELAALVEGFAASHGPLDVPDVSPDSLAKKLYSTFLSYLDPADFAYPLVSNVDARGSFTEILHTPERGQVSVNVAKPGVTKGQHWHRSKWEKFCVVSGEALIRVRRVGVDDAGKTFPIVEYRVSGDVPTVVEMAPGYTHSITNVSETSDLVTVMWANEVFDPAFPDTYYEEV